MRIPLARFSYSDVNQFLIVDREDEVTLLREGLVRFIVEHQEAPRGHTVTVVGNKGVGKSIVTRRVLAELRHDHSSQALILEVDCRERRSWRDVLSDICTKLRDELFEMRETLKLKVPDYALDAAGLLRDVARMDKVERTELHKTSLRFTSKQRLASAISLRKAFQVEAELDLTQESVNESALAGTIQLDEDRINRMLSALFADLFNDHWKVVLFLDNLDELDHRLDNESAIRAVRREVEGILKLHRAPIALVLNMRTYFAGVLGRELPATQRIEPLNRAFLMEAVQLRIRNEEPTAREAMSSEPAKAELDWLSNHCSTPLEFLWWVQHRATTGTLSPEQRLDGCKRLMGMAYPNFTWGEVWGLARAFGSTTRRMSREDLVKHLGDPWSADRAIDNQLVLPVDFWRPEMLTLDPRLHPLLALES